MNVVILWGATGQAKVLRECLKRMGISVVAMFDNGVHVEPPFPDIPLFYGKDGLKRWLNDGHTDTKYGCLVAIGGTRGRDRIEIQNYLVSVGLEPIIAKHPTAFVAGDVKVGEGSQILANSAICSDAVVGKACIINTGAIVDHECFLEDGVHVSPGAHLAGLIRVGKCSTIGIGATVLPRLKIGENSIVGAGSVVTKNVPPNVVLYGNPARVIRENK